MGILDGRPLGLNVAGKAQAQRESDTIFGSVFLGFIKDAARDGVILHWDVDPSEADAAQGLDTLRRVVGQVLAAAGDAQLGTHVDLGFSLAYDNATLQVAIAATPRPQDAGAVAQARQPIAWQPDTARRIREILANDALLTQNLDKEFGAYYGIVDDKANTQALVISSVRRLLEADDEGGRWLRGVPYHGLIGYDSKPAEALRASPKQAGSTEPTALIAQWNGKDHVCGYCHGMVWAVGQAACNFPDGRPFELGLGRNTHKLSSCFGCSTYLHANGWAPNAMHLGRSESWVPLPESEDALAAFNIGLGQPHEHQRIVTALNVSWERKIAQWLRDGATLIVQRGVKAGFTAAVVDTATALLQALPKRHDPRAVANLFLDALTVHDKDLLRLSRLVVQAPKPVH